MSMDNEFNRFFNAIKKLIRKECHRPNDMIYGTIVSVDPLKIDIGGNIILEKEKLFLGQMCRPHKVTIPHKHLIDAHLTEESKSLLTKKYKNNGSNTAGIITPGVPTKNNDENKVTYDTHKQNITKNDDEGTNERELQTDTHRNVNLGGVKISAFDIDVKGSTATDNGTFAGQGTYTPAGATPPTTDQITNTCDKSSIESDTGAHKHLIEEFETQDVHFPDTDYEDSVEMEIYPRLHINDIVLMFAFNNNQMYYVAERIEELLKINIL